MVTDGSAVLGLGNIGPGAALPVMEGKAALFKRFADIDAWPICLDTQDTDEIVRAVELIAPGFGGINLEDIAAPRCFEIERRLREQPRHPGLPRRPARHRDRRAGRADQRAALRRQEAAPTSGSWCPAAARPATAIVTLLLAAGAGDVVVWDREGMPVRRRRRACRPAKAELAARTNPRRRARRPARRRCAGADVFIGVSAPGVLQAEWIDDMADRSRRLRAGQPRPGGRPRRGRSSTPPSWPAAARDYPNQINNVLAFPGVFRGLLDARAKEITIDDAARAADAIAHVVNDEELNPNFIIPSVFHPDVPKAVAAAIRGADT